jgi:hypothetical protein
MLRSLFCCHSVCLSIALSDGAHRPLCAQSRRSTACTARNDESSRSHGVAVITLGPPGSKVRGSGAVPLRVSYAWVGNYTTRV